MKKKRSASRLVTEEEKERAFSAATRKFFAALGLDPDLSDAKIRFGASSGLSAEREHLLAKALGLQIGIQTHMNQLLPEIRTQEDLDNAMGTLETAADRGPTLVRDVMKQIRTDLPRRGGPGWVPKLDAQESGKVCNQISKLIRYEKLTLKQALAKTSEISLVLLGKKVSPRTLQKAWDKRDEFIES